MTEPSQSGSGRGTVLGMLLAFALGLGAMAWLITGTKTGRSLLAAPAPEAPKAIAVAAPPNPPDLATSDDIMFRLASAEARLAQLEARPIGNGGTGGALKAEALFMVLAAGRRIEAGQALGPIERELQMRFGSNDPAALGALQRWSAKPVSPDAIAADYIKIESGFAGGEGWWSQIRASFSNLITIRKAGAPAQSPAHAARQAGQLVEQGRIDDALMLLRGLPADAQGLAWIAEATRLVEAQRALNTLEDRALASPSDAAEPEPMPEPLPPTDRPPGEPETNPTLG